MDDFLNALTASPAFKLNRTQALQSNCCCKCGQPVNDTNLRTNVERLEYKISAMCGLCWDDTFKDVEE